MGWRDVAKRRVKFVRIPMTPTEARAAGKTFVFVRTWLCGCSATITVRARENRVSGPSNFQPSLDPRLAGHATVSSLALTWNGLLEERGWLSVPVTCPACQAGLSVPAFKAQRAAAVVRST